MECSFKFKHYKEILNNATRSGYSFTALQDFDNNRNKTPLIILRHDIDFAPVRALEFAKIENELGIKSTFFVRLHAKQYNPFNFRVFAALKEIAELGHEIGLHSEVLDFAEAVGEDKQRAFNQEQEVFKTLFEKGKFGVSPHSDFTGANNLDFCAELASKNSNILYNAYDAKFTDSCRYISDSLGKWKGGQCVCRLIGEEDRIYLLIHPVYWYNQHYHLEE